jgi:hypothetical protein
VSAASPAARTSSTSARSRATVAASASASPRSRASRSYPRPLRSQYFVTITHVA